MFENLVESTQGKKQGRSAYFVVTAVIWLTVLTTAIVLGIIQYNAVLNESEDTATLLAPPPPPPPPPPPAPAANLPKPTRIEGFVAAEKAPTEIKKPSAAPPPIYQAYSGEGV